MKYIVKDNQIGFVMKNGRFVKTIGAGKYNYSSLLGYTVKIEVMEDELKFDEVPFEILMKDSAFAAKVKRFVIPDGEVGFIYRNGSLVNCAKKNEYIFWNIFEEMDIKTYSMESDEVQTELSKNMMEYVPMKYYTKVVVPEGAVALLYLSKKLTRTLESGIYYFWNYKREVEAKVVNLKWQELAIAGQEILTKDKIGIRINVVCSYRITDAVKAVSERSNLGDSIYSFIQMTVRELVGNYRLDEILEKKVEIGSELMEIAKKSEADFFVTFASFGIKDIILPGEIRDIMNTVLVAEKKAQANVIERREEVASTRSLMNTAKLMEENETLFQLKKLEYLERICNRVGEVSVSNGGNVLEQLSKMML